MIIDSHIHVFDSSVAGAEENFPLWPGKEWGGSGEDSLRQMDEAGIGKAFLISYTPIDVGPHYAPERRDRMMRVFQHYLRKDYFIEVWERNRDRYLWFADSIDPRVPGYVERAAQDLDRGAAGLKMLPLFVDTEMGDPRWRPVFDLLRERDCPCIIDLSWWYADQPWFAPSVYGKYASFTEYVKGFGRLIEDYPEVRIQLAHYGTPRLIDRGDVSGTLTTGTMHYDRLGEVIDFMQAYPGLRCDLSAYQLLITPNDPYPYWRALKVLEVLVDGLGTERVHWGTDWPYLRLHSYVELISAIREAPFLGEEQVDQILGLNAQRFLEGK